MKRVSRNDIQAGMITAESITDSKHKVLLEDNAEITQAHADLLKTWDIEFIRVREKSDTDESLQEQLLRDKQEEAKAKSAVKREDIKKQLGITEDNIKSILKGCGDGKLYSGDHNTPVAGGAIKISSLLNNKLLDDYIEMLKVVDKVFAGAAREREFFIRDGNEFAARVNNFIKKTPGVIGYCLYPYRVEVNPLASHTMRTTIIAGKLAQLMNYSNRDIIVIIMGALMHDIGCATLPENMKSFKRKFTEEEFAIYQKHVLTGVNMLKGQKYLPREVLLIVGGHHERMDGSGYPLKLKADKIPNMVRLVALANEVDLALYPLNSGKEPINIAQLIEILPHWTGRFDPKICEVFAKYLDDFILSNRVTLDDGRMAEIIWNHKAYKEPVVRTGEGEIIDLNKITGLAIDNYSI